MTENTGRLSKAEMPVYTFQDVTALTHLASANGRLEDARQGINRAASLLTQAASFDPANRSRYDDAVHHINEAYKILGIAVETLTPVTTDVTARPHQVAAIQADLNAGPWRGGTGGYVNQEPPANS
jgi:hypothetical protein